MLEVGSAAIAANSGHAVNFRSPSYCRFTLFFALSA